MIQIECFELGFQIWSERILVLFICNFHVHPLLIDVRFGHDLIVVNLVSSSYHNVERACLVSVQDISPKRIRTAELMGAYRHSKSIATIEHDVHGLAVRGHPESHRRTLIDAVCYPLLCVNELNLKVEP